MNIGGAFVHGLEPDGTPIVISAIDIPVNVGKAFDCKEVLERAQLEKYRLDYLMQFGCVPFEAVMRGGDPPDFLVNAEDGMKGIDCSALALQGRRQAEALFDRFVKRLTSDKASGWPNLLGCDVTISFGMSEALPPKAHDRSLDTAIDDGLASIVVDRKSRAEFLAQVARDGVFPNAIPPELVSEYRHERFHVMATPIENWQPQDDFAERLGFHLHLQYQVTLANIASAVRRLLASHDNYATQHLLLSIGGPDLNGFRYPAEAMLGELLRAVPITDLQAQHVKRVTAHVWDSGEIIEFPVTALTGGFAGRISNAAL